MQPNHASPTMLACAEALCADDVNAALAAMFADLPDDARAFIAPALSTEARS